MSAIDTLQSIVNSELVNYDFRYCFVNSSKVPYRVDGHEARPNIFDDFVSLEELMNSPLLSRKRMVGIGISIQASKVCAIDIDKCFSRKFDITSIDSRGKDILDMFEDVAYCEFSFSGTGMRIIFKHDLIKNYSDKYYIKNSKYNIEYYEPSSSNRFVTVTGQYIANNPVVTDKSFDLALNEFLDKYMTRPQISHNTSSENLLDELEACERRVKRMLFENSRFQMLWFSRAPGAGKNESELDFQLLALLYENVTRNEEIIKTLFESSPYFNSKDEQHLRKWTSNDYRYYKYVYSHLR